MRGTHSLPGQQLDLTRVTLLDVRRVAELLGVHQRTVWRLVSSDDLPQPIRIGTKTVRWRLSDLEDYFEKATRQ